MNSLILLLVHVDVLFVWGQAPGDFQGICRTDFRYRIVHDWIPYVNDTADGTRGDVKWQVLIDQYDYQNIFGENSIPPGVWTEKNLDGDNRKFTSSGGICTNALQLRNTFMNSNSNNWVFTQSVSYLDAIEVIVNATVRFNGCHDRSNIMLVNPPCQNNFVTLHRYDTNSTRTEDEISTPNNYQPCFGDLASSRLEQNAGDSAIIIKRFNRPNFAMTYFGIQDIGTYGDLQRVIVYYRVAQGYEQGLVRCPNIALPGESSKDTVTVNCSCRDNSIPMGSLEVTCHGNGTCEGNPLCQCRAGYQYNKAQQVCQGCSNGTYRSMDITNCTTCPNMSKSDIAESLCRCKQGSYRAATDSIHDGCTTPPSAPRSPSVASSTNISCSVGWIGPSDTGGRNDIFYTIKYTREGSISGSSDRINTSNTSLVITNLKPVTTYQIKVTAENGVSGNAVSLDQLDQRTVTIMCTTTEGAPEKPEAEVVDNLLVIWQKPDTTNGNITNYEVSLKFAPFHEPVVRRVDKTRFYYILRQNEIPQNVTAHLQVRANTANHFGEWSDVYSFEPFGSPCPDPDLVTTEGPASECKIGIFDGCLLHWVIAAVIAAAATFLVYSFVLLMVCSCYKCCCSSHSQDKQVAATHPMIADFDTKNDTTL